MSQTYRHSLGAAVWLGSSGRWGEKGAGHAVARTEDPVHLVLPPLTASVPHNHMWVSLGTDTMLGEPIPHVLLVPLWFVLLW